MPTINQRFRTALIVIPLAISLMLGAYLTGTNSPFKHKTEHTRNTLGAAATMQLVAADANKIIDQATSVIPTGERRAAGDLNVQQVTWGPDGVPDVWCNTHDAKCTAIKSKAIATAVGFSTRTKDNVTHATLPDKWENKVRNFMSGGAAKTGPSDKRGNGGYGDMVGLQDCSVHGYGCYSNIDYQAKLSQGEKVLLTCAATVTITTFASRIPKIGKWLGLGKAQSVCFWGVVGYFLDIEP
jgi:hypothetical protein